MERPSTRPGGQRLLAVLGFGEIAVLTAAALGTITLLFYLGRVIDDGPVVLTPTPTVQSTPGATRTPVLRR